MYLSGLLLIVYTAYITVTLDYSPIRQTFELGKLII